MQVNGSDHQTTIGGLGNLDLLPNTPSESFSEHEQRVALVTLAGRHLLPGPLRERRKNERREEMAEGDDYITQGEYSRSWLFILTL